jgi:hypothetical protein
MKAKIQSIAVLLMLGFVSTAAISQAAPDVDTASPSATFTVRPSAYSGGGAGGPYLDPTYAYDDNLSTASTGSVSQAIKGAKVSYETWYGFPSAPPDASAMQLNVSSSAASGRGGDAILYYSLNGGTTFQPIYSVLNGSRAKQTDVISLSNTQDLTQVQVKAYILADTDGTFLSTASQSIYEIWITGTD